MRKILLGFVLMLGSVAAIAHSGHAPFEFSSIVETFRHHFTSSYHIVAMLMVSMAFIVSAVVVSNSKKILSVVFMVLGLTGSMLGMSFLLT